MSDPSDNQPLDGGAEQPTPDPYDELPPPVFPPVDQPVAQPSPMTQAGGFPESSQATTALVLTILNFILCPILGPIGWYLANQEITAINAGCAFSICSPISLRL